MEITIVEGKEHARFSVGSGDDALKLTAYVIASTGHWGVNWAALGTVQPEIARAYAALMVRAATFCDDRNASLTK